MAPPRVVPQCDVVPLAAAVGHPDDVLESDSIASSQQSTGEVPRNYDNTTLSQHPAVVDLQKIINK